MTRALSKEVWGKQTKELWLAQRPLHTLQKSSFVTVFFPLRCIRLLLPAVSWMRRIRSPVLQITLQVCFMYEFVLLSVRDVRLSFQGFQVHQSEGGRVLINDHNMRNVISFYINKTGRLVSLGFVPSISAKKCPDRVLLNFNWWGNGRTDVLFMYLFEENYLRNARVGFFFFFNK